MLRQKEMESKLLMAHRQFISGLEKTIDLLNDDIKAVEEISGDLSNEWRKSRENFLDYLHKNIYSISEPRWADNEDSKKIHELRNRIKELYAHFKGTGSN